MGGNGGKLGFDHFDAYESAILSLSLMDAMDMPCLYLWSDSKVDKSGREM